MSVSVAKDKAMQAAEQRVEARLVGRGRELEMLAAAVKARRDVVLEGPPGTSKTTLLRALTEEWGLPLIMVEGNAELTPARLLGHHDPATVLREGYTEATFTPGPLVEAMQAGGFLYIEEFNRAPDETLNLLLMALADRQVTVPRLGLVRAAASFRVVASMNPFDNVGTRRLSQSITDRLCRMTVDYQDEAAERRIVGLRAPGLGEERLASSIVADSVALTRATRAQEDLIFGSSVRGAIDTAALLGELVRRRGIEDPDTQEFRAAMLDALTVALSGRIRVDVGSGRSPESVLFEIWCHYYEISLDADGPD